MERYANYSFEKVFKKSVKPVKNIMLKMEWFMMKTFVKSIIIGILIIAFNIVNSQEILPLEKNVLPLWQVKKRKSVKKNPQAPSVPKANNKTKPVPTPAPSTSKRAKRFNPPKKTPGEQQSGNGIKPPQHPPRGSGSGFFITRQGHIVTNYHVVKNAGMIWIRFKNNFYPGTLLGKDKKNDLAIIKVSGTFTPIKFPVNKAVVLGEAVFTIGFPMPDIQGVAPKVSKGIINSLSGVKDDYRFYQVDLPLQPGNSGGMLADDNGNIIGVVTAVLKPGPVYNKTGVYPQNVNYAVKSEYLASMLTSLNLESLLIYSDDIAEEKFEKVVARASKSVVQVLIY